MWEVVIEAHADEISWFVHYITKEGYIYLRRNGGSDHQIAPSKRVNIHTSKGMVKAVFGWPAIHTRTPGKEEPPKLENISIDVGAKEKKEVEKKTIQLLKDVGLDESFLSRYPHELSGGQRQRVCIARAISLKPEIIICDECVSALDVSVQATILNLLNSLKEKYGFTYIFISHDLSVVKYMSDRIVVLFDGEVVEYQEADKMFLKPTNDYTRKLIKASL